MKGVYYWLIAAGVVIIGLLVAVIVLATRDNDVKTEDNHPNIGKRYEQLSIYALIIHGLLFTLLDQYMYFNNGRLYPIVGIG